MRWLAVVLLAGCRFHPGAAAEDARGDAPPVVDASRIDAAVTFPDCYGDAFAMVCIDPPAMPLSIGAPTDAASLCLPFSSPQHITACVVAGATVTITKPGALRATTAPLIVVSPGKIDLAGAIDVSSTATSAGGGHDVGTCTTPGAATDGDGGGGGGAGGSFGGKGGDGGAGEAGANGTAAAALDPPTQLRGGCAGGAGSLGAAGGAGGGAVMVASRMEIEVHGSGSIDASGAGGAGGQTGADPGGAGGGGTGGMIVLDAPIVQLDSNASVFANGGGGGEGGDSGSGGHPGLESTGPDTQGDGGSNGTLDGGNGGGGAYGSTRSGLAQAHGDDGNPIIVGPAAGGGGGGGAGVIRILAGMTTGADQVAPPAP